LITLFAAAQKDNNFSTPWGVFIKEQVGMSGHKTLHSKIEIERWLGTLGHVA
jgi:hypothetical protein